MPSEVWIGIIQVGTTLFGVVAMGGVLWAKVDRIERQQDWMMNELFVPRGGSTDADA